jgi:integrase
VKTNKPKTLRKAWPKVRPYVKHGKLYYVVDLRRKHYKGPQLKWFSDREIALKHAADMADKVSKSGIESIADADDAAKLKAWGEQCAVYGKTLEQAMDAALELFAKEKSVKDSPYMAELLSVWLDDKITGLRTLRPKTIESIRDMVKRFKIDFGMARVKEIDSTRIESYLKSRKVSDQTRLNICRYLQQFFNWSINKGHFVGVNPAISVKKEIHVDAGSPAYFNIEQCKALLNAAQMEKHKPLLAYIALGLFAGIRPEEVEKMTWEKNIKMDAKEIHLFRDKTKTKKDRYIQMSENLHKWLEHCEKIKPLVPSANLQNMRVRLVKEAGIQWVADGLRHSFATYYYAKEMKDGGKNLEILRSIMGNSPNVIEKFYKGAISKTEVDKFWSLLPN